MFEWIVGCFTAVAITAIIIGGIVYGCLTSNEQYYTAQKMCVEAGGSWIVGATSATSSAQCLRLAAPR